MSSQVYSIFMNTDCLTSQGNLCQCLIILTVKKYFHISDNSLCFSLWPLPLVRSRGTPSKVSCWLKCIYMQPWAFFFLRLNYSGSFSLLSWEMLQARNSLCGPYSVCPVCPCLFFWDTQHQTKHTRSVSPVLARGSPAGNALCYVAQDTLGSLCLEGALLADSQLVHQVTHGLLL